jgi:hypothetical protein
LLDKVVRKSNSQHLKEAIQAKGVPLFMMYRQLWDHPRVGELVIPFLVLMHQIIRASVPLMEAADQRAAERADDDPLCALLHEYLCEHIEEERHHDLWVLEDLATAGISRQDVLGPAPTSAVAAMAGAQYYWIHHHHPVALLGYIRLLEGNPPSTQHIERLQALSGLPASTFRTYRMHGELDPGHLNEFDAMLDNLPLSEAQADLIATSAGFSADMLANAISEIMCAVEKQAPDRPPTM